MSKLPIVIIVGEKGEPCVINLSDYDKDKHELVGPKTGTPSLGDFDKKAAIEILKEAGISVAKNATVKKIKEALTALEVSIKEASDEKAFSVVPKDDKFVIVDGEGVHVGELYDTEKAAKDSLQILEG